MELKKSFEKVKESDEFKEWKGSHADAYLCSCFVFEGMGSAKLVHEDLADWQFDFYDKENKKITSFIVGNEIEVQEDDAFKKKEDDVLEINLDDVKIDFEKALKIVEGINDYKNEKVKKRIIILQDIGKGIMWNLSFITDSFKVLNVKISAVDGKIVSENISSLLSFKKS